MILLFVQKRSSLARGPICNFISCLAYTFHTLLRAIHLAFNKIINISKCEDITFKINVTRKSYQDRIEIFLLNGLQHRLGRDHPARGLLPVDAVRGLLDQPRGPVAAVTPPLMPIVSYRGI